MAGINFLSSSSNPYQAFAATSKFVAPAAQRPAEPQATPAATGARTTDTVTISQAARDALAAAEAKANKPSPVEAKLVEIQAKSPIARTPNDVNYVQLHAPKLAESMIREQKAPLPV